MSFLSWYRVALVLTLILMAVPFTNRKRLDPADKRPRSMFGLIIDAFATLGRSPFQGIFIGLCLLTHLLPTFITWQSTREGLRSPELVAMMSLECIVCLGGGLSTYFLMSRGHLSFDPPEENWGRMTFVGYALVLLNLAGASMAVMTVVTPGWLPATVF